MKKGILIYLVIMNLIGLAVMAADRIKRNIMHGESRRKHFFW